VLKIQINDPLRANDVDLRTLVSHRTAVQANDSVESVFAAFAKNNVEFIAILDAERLAGLCSRHQISELLGGRYGFSLWARKPIGGHLSPNEIRVFVTTPIGDVLKKVFARGEDAFYDDVLLVDEDESFLGLITTQTLFKVQNALLRTNIRDLIEKEREIQAKNEQTQMDLRMAMELQQALMPVTYPLFPANATADTARLRFDLIDDFEAHLTGGAGDDAEGGFVVACVQVFALHVDDVHDLSARDFANFGLVRLFGTGGDVGRFLQEDCGRWTFRDERERFVFEDSDDDRKNVAGLFLCSGVKFLAERHDVHAARAESSAHRRCGIRLARRNLKFDLCDDFFSHVVPSYSRLRDPSTSLGMTIIRVLPANIPVPPAWRDRRW
jgi:hypothetical protein